jgi:AhpC/TSA family.
MRCIAVIFVALMLFLLPARSQQVDSLKLKELDSRLEEYFRTMEAESASLKRDECDLLIGAAKEPALQQHIALKAYDHYMNSLLMGDDAVAVHIVDRWFASGKVKMNSEVDLMNAKIYADFNRQSLIGCKAPEIEVFREDGSKVRIGGSSKRFRILFFYDTLCAKCKLEAVMLKSLLDHKDYPVIVYAVCTGSDREAWENWQTTRLAIEAPHTEVVHAWDPEFASGYQMKYGVIQTPRVFLLGKDGTILGRSLDSVSLEQLLDASINAEFHEYGGDEAMSLMNRLFQSYGDSLSASSVSEVMSLLSDRTLALGDTVSYKNLCGDMLYFLSSQRKEAFKEGSLPFVRENILSRPDIWSTSDDSLRVLGLANLMGDLLSRTPVGSRLPSLNISGWRKVMRRGGYVLFHTHGCGVCERELALVDSLGLRCAEVDVDRLSERKPGLMARIRDTFDLSALPLTIEVDRGGVVKRRYVSLLDDFAILDK